MLSPSKPWAPRIFHPPQSSRWSAIMGQRSSQLEPPPSPTTFAKLTTNAMPSSLEESPRTDDIAPEASTRDDAQRVGMKRKRGLLEDRSGEGGMNGATSSPMAPPEQLSAGKKGSKKRRQRDSSVSALEAPSSALAATNEPPYSGPVSSGFTAINKNPHEPAREHFDLSGKRATENLHGADQHPRHETEVEHSAVAETYRTYETGNGFTQATPSQVPAPSVHIPGTPPGNEHQSLGFRFLPHIPASRSQVKTISNDKKKKPVRKHTTSEDAAQMLARKKKKRKSPTDSGYSTSGTNGGLSGSPMVAVVVDNASPSLNVSNSDGPQGARIRKTQQRSRLSSFATTNDMGDEGHDLLQSNDIPVSETVDKGKGKAKETHPPPADLATGVLSTRQKASGAPRDSRRNSENPFVASQMAALIRAEEQRERDLLDLHETPANQPKRASKNIASQKISDFASLEAEARRELAAEAKRKAARKSLPSRLDFLTYTGDTQESEIPLANAHAAHTPDIGAASRDTSRDVRGDDTSGERQQAASDSPETSSDSAEEDQVRSEQREKPRPTPLPQASQPLFVSSIPQNDVATSASEDDEPSAPRRTPGQIKAEMLSRVAATQRGEELQPPCDRCRELGLKCLKHATSCLDCNRRHRKCAWNEVTNEELGGYNTISHMDEEAAGTETTDQSHQRPGTRNLQKPAISIPFVRKSSSVKKTPNGQGNDSDSSDTDVEPEPAGDLESARSASDPPDNAGGSSRTSEHIGESGPFIETSSLPQLVDVDEASRSDDGSQHAEDSDVNMDRDEADGSNNADDSVEESLIDTDRDEDDGDDQANDSIDVAHIGDTTEDEDEEQAAASEGEAKNGRTAFLEAEAEAETESEAESESMQDDQEPGDQRHETPDEEGTESEHASTNGAESADAFRIPESSAKSSVEDEDVTTPPRRMVKSAPNSARAKAPTEPKRAKDRRKSAPVRTAPPPAQNETSTPTRQPPSKPRGSLTQNELQKLERFKRRYCAEHDLDARAFAERVQANANNNKALGRFWDQVVQAVAWAGRRAALQKAVRRVYHNCRRGAWTAAEDAHLATLHAELGAQWRRIADALERMPEDVRDRYRNHTKGRGRYVSSQWDGAEDKALVRAVAECAALEVRSQQRQAEKEKVVWEGYEPDFGKLVVWGVISDKMGGTRSRISCRDRVNLLVKGKRIQVQTVVGFGIERLLKDGKLDKRTAALLAVTKKTASEEAQEDSEEAEEETVGGLGTGQDGTEGSRQHKRKRGMSSAGIVSGSVPSSEEENDDEGTGNDS